MVKQEEPDINEIIDIIELEETLEESDNEQQSKLITDDLNLSSKTEFINFIRAKQKLEENLFNIPSLDQLPSNPQERKQ